VPSAQLISPSSELTRPAQNKSVGWLHAPQRVWLRRAIFQIHLWFGIILAAYSVVIGVTGAILIFNEEIEDALYAKQLHISPTPRQTTFDSILTNVRVTHPGWLAVGLRDIDRNDRATMIVMSPMNDPTTTNLRYVYVDPNTGRILLDRLRYDSVLGWVFHLHLYLLLDRIGLTISGWMALGLLILCISGIIIWWPGVARWTAALVLRRRSSWRRLNWDIHSVTGFWCCIALTAVSLTGVYFAFPLPIAGTIVKLTGGNLREAISYVSMPQPLPAKPGTPLLSVDRAIETINSQMAEAPPIFYLQLPLTPKDVYGGISYYPTTAPYTAARRVAIDPHSGAILRTVDTRRAPIGVRIVQYFHSVHFGTFAGTTSMIGYTVRTLWVFLGLAPAVLAITGLIMYWNRKLRPAWRRLRR
jgi:uncharacterized iron-regulated membrane protein